MDLALSKGSKHLVVVTILVILGWAAAAQAEDAPSAPAAAQAEDIPRAPAAARNLAEIPFQLVLPRGHLLGDWLGGRTWLEDHGVYPLVTFVTDALGNPTGGKEQGFKGASNLGVDLVFDFEKLTGLAAANLYVVAFAISWGPVMWVLLGEMFPNRMRGAALAVSGATNWAANFAVTVTFLLLQGAVGLGGAYGFYALAALCSLPFVWALVRETRGKTLEQM